MDFPSDACDYPCLGCCGRWGRDEDLIWTIEEGAELPDSHCDDSCGAWLEFMGGKEYKVITFDEANLYLT